MASSSGTFGFRNPVPFPIVIVNEGNAWDPSFSRVEIPISGLYFIHMSVGAPPGGSVNHNFAISVGPSVVFEINRVSTDHNGVDTLSRTGLMDFSTGTLLNVITDFNTYSDDGLLLTFIGFFVQ